MTMTDDDFTSNAAARLSPIAQVRAYWEALRVDGAVPLRSRINPRGIEAALSSTFLIERVAPGMARFRIAGMDLADLLGMEARGMPISAIFSPSSRPELADKLELVFQTSSILSLGVTGCAGVLQPALSAQIMILPLRDEAGGTGLALGCIAMKGAIGRTPRRIAIESSSLTPVIAPKADALVKQAGFAPQLVASNGATVAADTDQFAPVTIRKKRPHLRLVT
jgi:hypothetical protein